MSNKEFREDSPEETLLQFAYYLKETAKRHEKNIEDIEADNKLRDDKISKIREDMITLSGNMKSIAESLKGLNDKGNFGWLAIEKVAAFIAFLIIAGLMIWQILVT
jgi:hypothetical protein